MKKIFIALFAIALAACTGGGGGSSSSATDAATPGAAVISDYNISSNDITIAWAKTEGADADSWSAYHNDSPTCSAEFNTSSENQQSGSCSFTLLDGNNSIYVQLCNSADACSTSDTLRIEHSLAPGAIYLEQLPSSTSSNQLEVKWVKEQGVNGDLWYIFHNSQSACSGSFALPAEQQAQSASCSIDLDFGEHQFQARLCIDKPADTADICSDSAVHSLTSYFDSALELATPAIETLAASLPALATTINWSKNTADGSAGESWTFYRNNQVVCGGTLAADATTSSCSVELIEGSNSMFVRLCTDVVTYSGATCVDSAVIAVEGTEAYALEPGAISINTVVNAQTYAQSLTVDWAINSGNGVTQWYAQLNDSAKCLSTSSDYLVSGSCSVNLALGVNTISITGCNYGHEDSQSCATSAEISTEYIALPGTPEITSAFPATTYTSEHNLSWERDAGAAADYWLGLVNDTSKCSGDLLEQTPQGGSCIVELDSGVNAIVARLCIANESGSAYCSDSTAEQVELLAPVPAQPLISTPEQSVADDVDSIVLEWSKSSGANGSYWSLDNNGDEVAACSGQPIFSSGSSQSGSCSLPLALGSNRVSVHLCADNAASTASCSTSESVTIVRGSVVLEFTSASSASSAENNSEVFYTATVSANGSPTTPSSFSLSGIDSSLFSINSSGGLAFRAAPDYETPQDHDQDNTYELNISASDLDYSTSLEIRVSVSDSNDETPQVPSSEASTTLDISAITLDSVIYRVEASDADADDILSYTLAGVDASHFNLDSSSGELRFTQLPSLDQPQDFDGDNIYDLEISVSDAAANSTSFTLEVTVAEDIDSAPEFGSASASVEFPENSTAIVYDANATDADGDTLSYSLAGLDSAHFNLDPESGQLSFSQAPNFELPQDHDQDNTYELAIGVTDSTHSASLELNVSVSNVNEAHYFEVSSSSLDLSENDASSLALPAATDPEVSSAITYELLAIAEGNSDYQYFNLTQPADSAPSIAFADQAGADYENISDHNSDHTYEFILRASDDAHSASIDINLSITNLNDNLPTFVEPNPEPIAILESSSADSILYSASATDADGDALTYGLEGLDSPHFALDSATGQLSLRQAFDYETPQDHNADNTYELEISAMDNTHSTSVDLNVSVSNINEAHYFASTSSSLDLSENDTSSLILPAAIDPDASNAISYELIAIAEGNNDYQYFNLTQSENPTAPSVAFADPTGADYESTSDHNSDHTYEFILRASDADHNASIDINITITNLNDNPPTFTDPNPDTISLSEKISPAATIYIAFANDVDGDTIAYSLTGLDSAHFNLDPESAELSFKESPNFESPQDQGQDNTYAITVNATDADSTHSTSVDLSVEISDVDEAPQFTQDSETIEVPENTSTAVIIYTAIAIDEDGDTITYTLSGADSAHFILSSTTGALNFATVPDFENPQDQNGDNDYYIEIQATSTNNGNKSAASLQLSITITDVEEYAPYFDNAASVASLTEDPSTEGQQTPILALEFEVYDTEDDAANRALSLELEGDDSSLFQLATSASANSHEVHFITSPDFDHPHDSDQDSNYSFTIVATDSDGTESQFSSTIVVEGINDEAPYFDPAAYAHGEIIYILENNNSAFLTLAGYDADRSDWSAADPAMHYQPNLDQLSFALTATIAQPDSELFYLNPDTLELSPKEPFDYETPQQQNYHDNLYYVEVAITDSAGNSNVDDPDAATRIVYVKVEDVENDSLYPQAKSGPQIPWFYSADGEMGVSERMKIPWYIYAGEGVVEWKMYVNGDVKCSYTVADLSSPVTSGTCALLGSEFVVGSLNNTATVSVVYADGSSASSETVTFGYAVAEIEGYYPEQAMVPGGNSISSGHPADCADVEIGEPVNHDSHSDCYNYLLYDDNFGGRFDDVPSYLWSGQYGLPFDVIAYFIEWGVYARDFDAHDLPANWLSTVLYSFIKFEGDNTTADDECEDCTFSGAVAIADPWAAFDKPFYMPGEEEKYADEAESEEELAEILLDKGVSTGKGIFQQFWLLKQKFPHLKTCLSVGGWSFSRPFPLVASDPSKRATFTKSIVDMAVEYHFDCIDIDWEFPGKAGGDRVAIHDGVATYDLDGDGISPFVDASEADAGYYVDLIAALRSEIDSRLDAEHIEINSAVYTSTEGMDLMDYGAFSGDLDGIHMMTYDYYGAWDPHTGLQAALYANADPVSDDVATAYGDPYNPEHNIASAMARGVNNAIANGFGSELSSTAANIGIRQKIVPGLAFYGRNYSGVNIDEPVPGKYMVRATGTTGNSDGSAERLGWEPGNLNYAQIDGVYFQGGTVKGNADYDAGGHSTAGRTWTYNWDDEAHVPFLYDADSGSFITYSDPRSIFFQTCHAAWHNSKGVMFWEISGDSANFELVQYIHFALHGYTIKSAEDTNVECDALAGIGEGETVYADDSGGTYMTYTGLEELAELGYINEYAFDVTLFPWRNGDPSISDGSKTYTWDGFLKAAKNYPEFADQRHGLSTSVEARLREVAAFLANAAHTTAYPSSGSYALSNLGGELGSTRYDAGYYFQQEPACAVGGANYGQDICSYCDASHADYGEACAWLYADDSTKVDDFYYGRGPLQLQWNYHYGAFAEDYYSSADLLLYEPNKLVTDSEAAFASALWRWMTPMDGKPSPHQVMTDQYEEQANFNRYPSFGMTINVLNGEQECGTAYDEDSNRNRIGHFITILKSFNDTFREIEDPYRDIDPWTANYDFTITTNGSYPDSVLDFDEDEENIIERYSDVETYLSCKNMKNYE